MKSVFLFLVFLVAASATFLDTSRGKDVDVSTFGERFFDHSFYKTADKEFLTRNKNLVRLLDHITNVNTYVDQRAIGKDYRIDANLDKYFNVEAVKEFLRFYKYGFLPKYKIFSVTNDLHRDQAIALFHVFYYAKDFETFYKTACWARDNVNEGMFVYALTVAVIHRMDTRGMKLPPPYEIYPFYFFNTDVVQKAVYLKMQEGIVDKKVANELGVRQVDNTFFIRSNYSGWYVNYNEEILLNYFTEDIDLNTYYYYFHTTYPFWMSSEDFGMVRDRRGEFYLYTHQQLLARYYMERLSNNLGEVDNFLLNKPIKTGFFSSLRHSNGLDMPSRPNFYNFYSHHNLWDITKVLDYELRIRKAIDTGFIYTEDGRTLSLRNPEDIEKLGNIVQGNKDSYNTRYYLLGVMTAKKLLSGNDDYYVADDFFTNPGVIEKYETALRDPMFYTLFKRLMFNYERFKETLRPYTRDEVSFPGVKIEDVSVDKLVTFFDEVDVDITKVVKRTPEEMENNHDKFTFKAFQKRLNHKAFDVKLDIDSDKSTEAVIRIFLGPKYDSFKRRINFEDNRFNFFELDFFVYNLKTGKNVIKRNSREFMTTIEDRTPARELIRKLTTCISGSEECLVDKYRSYIGFPDRLVLPKGKTAGMPFMLYVVITPLRTSKTFGYTNVDSTKAPKDIKNFDYFTNYRCVDDNAFGFPLDRPFFYNSFFNTNMKLTEVMIFHRDFDSTYRYKNSDSFTYENDKAYGKDFNDKEYADRTYDRDFAHVDGVNTMDRTGYKNRDLY